MLESLIYNFGYIGLFIISFLASTIIPLGSEPFVILMTTMNYNIWLILIFASIGNYFGSLTNYYIGEYGDRFFLTKYVKYDLKKMHKLEDVYSRWGSPLLFFAWLPIVGDSLCFIAGILKLNLRIFTFWVMLGKVFRYVILIGTANFLVGI